MISNAGSCGWEVGIVKKIDFYVHKIYQKKIIVRFYDPPHQIKIAIDIFSTKIVRVSD